MPCLLHKCLDDGCSVNIIYYAWLYMHNTECLYDENLDIECLDDEYLDTKCLDIECLDNET